MPIRSQLVGATTVLYVQGTLTAAAGERGLRDLIRQAVADGVRTVIVNMQDAAAIDSSGVSDLASSHMVLAGSGGVSCAACRRNCATSSSSRGSTRCSTFTRPRPRRWRAATARIARRRKARPFARTDRAVT